MIDRVMRWVQIFSLCFLTYLAGVAAHEFGKTDFLKEAFRGLNGMAWISYKTFFRENTYETQTWWWHKSRYTERGALVHNREKISDGLTLYGSGHAEKAFLVDIDGKVIHEWALNYNKEIGLTVDPGIMKPEDVIFWRDVYLYPNGDLLVIPTINGESPWGLNPFKIDKNSSLIWSVPVHAHHDMDVASDGRIFVMTQEIVAEIPSAPKTLEMPAYDERITIIKNSGEIEKELSLFWALKNSEFAYILEYIRGDRIGDYLHSNSVSYIEEDLAQKVSYVDAGNIVVNLRDLNLILVVDVEKEKVTWASLTLSYQGHDADILENGNILMFDNYSEGERSAIIEVDPFTQKIVWSYDGTDERPLRSKVRARQETLANGNILIVESNGGRLLEVNRDGELLWEFFNPHRVEYKGKELIPIVSGGRRYLAENLSFL